jgi:hypothetical protein
MFSSELKSEAHFLPRVTTKRKLTQPLHFLKTPVFSKWLVKKILGARAKDQAFLGFPKGLIVRKSQRLFVRESQKTSLLGSGIPKDQSSGVDLLATRLGITDHVKPLEIQLLRGLLLVDLVLCILVRFFSVSFTE